MDTAQPLTDAPIGFWEGLPNRCGHLLDGHLATLHLDNVVPDGHLCGRHLAAEHPWPAAFLSFVTAPLYFGLYQLAVGMVDAVGNRSSQFCDPIVRVVNAAPRPARSLRKTGFDPLLRRLTFAFTPSPDL